MTMDDRDRCIAVLTYRPLVNRPTVTGTARLKSYSGSKETGVSGRTVEGRTLVIPPHAIVSLEPV